MDGVLGLSTMLASRITPLTVNRCFFFSYLSNRSNSFSMISSFTSVLLKREIVLWSGTFLSILIPRKRKKEIASLMRSFKASSLRPYHIQAVGFWTWVVLSKPDAPTAFCVLVYFRLRYALIGRQSMSFLNLEEKLVSALSVADLSHKVAVVRSLVYLHHDRICFYGLKKHLSDWYAIGKLAFCCARVSSNGYTAWH